MENNQNNEVLANAMQDCGLINKPKNVFQKIGNGIKDNWLPGLIGLGLGLGTGLAIGHFCFGEHGNDDLSDPLVVDFVDENDED
jgi:hypothetical protein